MLYPLAVTYKKRKNSPYHSSFFPFHLKHCKQVLRRSMPSYYGLYVNSRLALLCICYVKENSLLCMIFRLKPPQHLFVIPLSGFRPELATCTICGNCGSCHIHNYCSRLIIDFHEHHKVTENLCIMRIMCNS